MRYKEMGFRIYTWWHEIGQVKINYRGSSLLKILLARMRLAVSSD